MKGKINSDGERLTKLQQQNCCKIVNWQEGDGKMFMQNIACDKENKLHASALENRYWN